jgi:hypothetical protein
LSQESKRKKLSYFGNKTNFTREPQGHIAIPVDLSAGMDQTYEFRELMRRYRRTGERNVGADEIIPYDRPRYSPSPFIMQASDMVRIIRQFHDHIPNFGFIC